MTVPALTNIDPKMVFEIAAGMEAPAAIAARYGLSPGTWAALEEHPPFVHAVEAQQAELKSNGYTFRMKAALAAEMLLDDVYLRATAETTHISDKLEALKYFAKLGDREPKKDVGGPAQPGFAINIVMGGQTLTLSATAAPSVDAPQAPKIISGEVVTHSPLTLASANADLALPEGYDE